jgi:hypothetical protein
MFQQTNGVQCNCETIKQINGHLCCTTPCAKNKNKPNKTCVPLQTTGGKDESNIVIIRKS